MEPDAPLTPNGDRTFDNVRRPLVRKAVYPESSVNLTCLPPCGHSYSTGVSPNCKGPVSLAEWLAVSRAKVTSHRLADHFDGKCDGLAAADAQAGDAAPTTGTP